MKLALQQFNTYNVDWLTYAHDREAGKIGLGEFIAKQLGRDGEIELLECGNDTQHMHNAALDKYEMDPIWVKERADVIERLKTKGHIEVWALRVVLTALVERGWLPPGHYVVKMSW